MPTVLPTMASEHQVIALERNFMLLFIASCWRVKIALVDVPVMAIQIVA